MYKNKQLMLMPFFTFNAIRLYKTCYSLNILINNMDKTQNVYFFSNFIAEDTV